MLMGVLQISERLGLPQVCQWVSVFDPFGGRRQSALGFLPTTFSLIEKTDASPKGPALLWVAPADSGRRAEIKLRSPSETNAAACALIWGCMRMCPGYASVC